MGDISTSTEKIPVTKILKGRFKLIEQYEKGRTKDLVLEPWEDPEIQIYHSIDRYGFISEEKQEKEQDGDSKKQAKDALRVKKWLKACKKWQKFEHSDKLQDKIYKGIPLVVRGRVWSMLLGVEDTMARNREVYESMKELGMKWGVDLRQIDVDVNRTYRNHIMFRRRYDVRQQALFNVLVAYSVYNSEVGYCQGMSQIAALMLMFLSEEEAFWAFVKLMTGRKHMMHGFFIPRFPKLSRYQDHFNRALKKTIPKLKKHLDKNSMFPNLYTVKWFMQCFLDRLPFTLSLRFWDIYVLEGEKILVAMAVTVMKLHKNTLLKLDMEGMMDFFTSHISHTQPLSDDKVITLLRGTYDSLRRIKLHLPTGSPEQLEDERPKKGMGDYQKPSLDQLVAIYEDGSGAGGDEVAVEDNDVSEARVEIPADGGLEHLPAFTSNHFSQMVDIESGSEEGDGRDVDAEISMLEDANSSKSSLTNSDLPSPATSLASPARTLLHKRFRPSAVTPNSFEDETSVFSSSSSVGSHALQNNSLKRLKEKVTSQNAFEMLQALNDMLPAVSTHAATTLSQQLLFSSSLKKHSSDTKHSSTTQHSPLTTPNLNSRSKKNLDSHKRWATTVCAISPPSSPALPSSTCDSNKRPVLFSDSAFPSPPRSLLLFTQSFNRTKPLRSEGDESRNPHDVHIPICHVPPSPLPTRTTHPIQSDSIRSRLSLYDWPTTIQSRLRPLSTHLPNSLNLSNDVSSIHDDSPFQTTSPCSLYNSTPSSLTPIKVLHLKTVAPFKVSPISDSFHPYLLSNITSPSSSAIPTSSVSSSHLVQTSSTSPSSSSFPLLSSFPLSTQSSFTPPSHKRPFTANSTIPENVEVHFSNHLDKQPSSLQKPQIFSNMNQHLLPSPVSPSPP